MLFSMLKYIRSLRKDKDSIKQKVNEYIAWREKRWPYGSHEVHRTIIRDLLEYAEDRELDQEIITSFLEGFNSKHVRNISEASIVHYLELQKLSTVLIDVDRGEVYTKNMATEKREKKDREYVRIDKAVYRKLLRDAERIKKIRNLVKKTQDIEIK